MPKKKPTKVYRYDGQSIWTSSDSGYASYSDYELGSFLGGGAAGVVYEAECFKTKRHLAVKVLNPIGYKLAPSGSLRFCEVVVKGLPYGDVGGGFGGRGSRGGGHGFSSGGSGGGAGKMSEKHVWWLVNASTRQTIAAYYDARTGVLKEMTLPKCIEVWGLGDEKGRRAGARGGGRDRGKRDRERDRMRQEERLDGVYVGGEWLSIPPAPAKYDKFLRARASIFREISNMLQLSEHPNILRLHEALELVQDSKATIFLVLELARGGELFDRIKVDCGADEGAARHYFGQLLSGVRHCHDRGVCHRDLKPENLLLADPDDSSVLKIADFGFSALFRELESESSSGEDSSGPTAGSGGGGGSGVGVGVGVGVGPPTLRRKPSGLSMGGRARAGAGAGGGASASTSASASGGGSGRKGREGRGVRRLTSVVGSPYYVAPEVLREDSGHGYDGTKADVWSMGVILYAMLAGNLPFEKELLTCPRFAKFGAWARQPSATASLRAHCSGNPKNAMDMDCLDYPPWFFPQHFSFAARSLLSGLLHPDASSRLSVRQALRHPWVLDGKLYYPGSGGGSSSDGSDLSVGRGGVEEDHRSRCPQDIPSELLGADSDDEEVERLPEVKDSRERGFTRSGHRLAPSPPPLPAVVASRGGLDSSSIEGVSSTVEAMASAKIAASTSTAVLGGIREEDVADSEPEVDAAGGKRSPALASVGFGRQTSSSPPTPAPPPTGADPKRSSDTKEDADRVGVGSGGSGGVNVLKEGIERMSVQAPGTVGGEVGRGDGIRIEDDSRLAPRSADDKASAVSSAAAVAVAAEAAAEEAAAAKEASATRAAMAAAAVAAAKESRRANTSPWSRQQPLAKQCKARSPRPVDVFSSPPLAPLGSGRAVEEEEPEFLLDAGPPLPPERGRAKSREGLPPSGAGQSRLGGGAAVRSLGMLERPLNMGVAGMAMVEAEAEKREGVAAVAPPAFHDLVKRSTRFMTSVPAAVVLCKIATIINEDAHPLPYPYRNIRQKAVVHQDEYKLEIMRGGVLVCTVQIYLLGGEQRAAQYMVEFLRGQLDIFLFKRFYEDVRCKLNDLVKKDYSLALLESGTCTHRFRRFSNLA